MIIYTTPVDKVHASLRSNPGPTTASIHKHSFIVYV